MLQTYRKGSPAQTIVSGDSQRDDIRQAMGGEDPAAYAADQEGVIVQDI